MLNPEQNGPGRDWLADNVQDAGDRTLPPAVQADRYLELYHNAAVGLDGVFVLTLIDAKTSKVRPHKFAIGDVKGMVAECIARAPQYNVYFAPGILRKDLPTGERGTFKHLDSVLAIVIDDDADTGKRATLPPGIEPSLQLTTSRLPTINQQHHFVFSRPLPPNEAKVLAELLHKKCGGDHGTKDVAHVWRVPGTLNHPSAAKLKRGRPATPQHVDVTGGSFKLIDPDDLRRALDAMPDPTPQSRKTYGSADVPHRSSIDRDGVIARLPGWLSDLVETEVAVDDRSSFCYRVMQDLMEHGLSDSEISVVARNAPFAAKFAERGDLEAEIVRERKQWLEKGSTRADTATASDATNVKVWPTMQSAAMHGIVGKIARLATENSEADPVAVMATTLAFAGALLGRNQFARIGDDVHHSRHFFAIVGASSRARKGTSFGPVCRIFNEAERTLQSRSALSFPSDCTLQVSHGPLSSGEGLIYAIRDATEGSDVDDGVRDKRILCVEGELGAVFRAFQRTGNTLSTTLRVAFDGSTMAPLTKHSRICATAPHVCIIGHITQFELRELLTGTEIWNGLGNRFMWMCVRRPKLVPLPLPMPGAQLAELAKELARVVGLAHSRDGTELVFSTSAEDKWAKLYREVSLDRPGILGAVTARSEAHVRRLALTYAQLDGADRVELVHLDAALAIGRFCDESADYLFGGKELDPVAQRILEALASGPKTQTDIVNLFARHKSKEKLAGVLTELQERGRITLTQKQTGGAPIRQWSLTQ